MEQELLDHKEDDIHKYQSQIDDLLKEEIVTRYYYQEGRLRASLVDDLDLKGALEILNDKNAYQSLLRP